MNGEDARRHFLWGVALIVAVQAVFMGGGLLVERLLDTAVTGVPSLVGLSLVLVVASVISCRTSEYVLLGSFSLAFLAPAVLFLVVVREVFPVAEKLVYFSLGYMCALILAVWFYIVFKTMRGDYGRGEGF